MANKLTKAPMQTTVAKKTTSNQLGQRYMDVTNDRLELNRIGKLSTNRWDILEVYLGRRFWQWLPVEFHAMR